MTGYRIIGGTGTASSLSLVATTRTLHILRAEAILMGSSVSLTPSSISSAAHSGGTVLTPAPLRTSSAAPPATATARANATVTGTVSQLGYEFAYDVNGINQTVRLQWAPQIDLLIAPGFGFRAACTTTVSTVNIIVHFEELQLDWSI